MPYQPQSESREERRMTGKIARLNKGFGFIEGPDGRDYFFHWTDMNKFSRHFRNLTQGEAVSFQPGKTESGPKAFDVKTTDTE